MIVHDISIPGQKAADHRHVFHRKAICLRVLLDALHKAASAGPCDKTVRLWDVCREA